MSDTNAPRIKPAPDDPDATVDFPARARTDGAANATRATTDASDAEDDRVLAIVSEYQAALDAGRRPDRGALLARHADIAGRLSACLDGLALANLAGAQVQAAAAAAGGGSSSLPGLLGDDPSADDDSGVPAVDRGDSAARELGDFKLIREVARGGMGVVYEAVQLSLNRRVAVKVLPFAATLDARHLQRFQNEARAAAQLHHTNIVPVYAVGCERSVHFYAMQMIDGQSLADVIRDLRGAGEAAAPSASSAGSSQTLVNPTPGGALSIQRSTKRPTFFRTVARLGLQAAEALDYAHEQGVVHRDVKPGNLLLDAKGNLWVTDFGLAHVYADSGLTQSGDLLGTLRYMSPEQASGRGVVLDQRTDVYSLGLTLYELLTLERALPGESREQLLRQIGVAEPRAPRSIDRNIPPELETILLTASAKEPADRYPTARAMADDLRRFLADEPIRARPPSLWDKGVKWTRRHRGLTVSALLMLAMTAVGSSIGTVMIAREQGRTQDAYLAERRRATEANEQRGRAERSFAQAREAVDYLAHVAAEEMDRPEFATVRKPMLEASLAYYQSFLADRKDDPSLAAQLDADRAKVSTILAELAAFDTFFRSQFRLRLLSERSVREDLKLSPEQVAAVREIANGDPGGRPGPGFGAGGGPGSAGGPGNGGGLGGGAFFQPGPQTRRSPGQDLEKFAALAAAIESKLARTLTPGQSTRLRQIFWQIRGASALNEPEVAEALSLTAAQKARVRAVQAASREARGGRRGGGWGGGGGGDRFGPAAMPDAADDTLAKALAALTGDQVAIWQAMIGEPFAGDPTPRDSNPRDRMGRPQGHPQDWPNTPGGPRPGEKSR